MTKSLGQLFMIGIAGKSLSPSERDFIVKNDIGGIILFTRNFESPQQLHALSKSIQECAQHTESRSPLWISVDMEGGRVARFRDPFTVWPPLKRLGEINSPELSFQFALSMGRELSAVGINLDFAPCLDIFSNPLNKVIGDRSVGSDANLVAQHGLALMRGYLKAGIVPCGKHFPGHGNTLIDSHEELPIENATLDELKKRELIPFREAFAAQLPMLMSAHIRFQSIDPTGPATFSDFFLRRLLREEMKFQGLLISDDLDMKALAKYHSMEEIPVRCLQAGIDILLYCNIPESHETGWTAVQRAISTKTLNSTDIENKVQRILQTKRKLITSVVPDWQEARRWVGAPEHKHLSGEIQAGRF